MFSSKNKDDNLVCLSVYSILKPLKLIQTLIKSETYWSFFYNFCEREHLTDSCKISPVSLFIFNLVILVYVLVYVLVYIYWMWNGPSVDNLKYIFISSFRHAEFDICRSSVKEGCWKCQQRWSTYKNGFKVRLLKRSFQDFH